MDVRGKQDNAMVRVAVGSCHPGDLKDFVIPLASIYRVHLRSPSAMARDLRAAAVSLDPVVANIAIKHSLVCTANNGDSN